MHIAADDCPASTMHRYGLSTLATMIASVDRPFGDSRRIRQQSPFLATVAVFGDKLSPKTATIVSSVDRPLDWQCSL